MSVTHCFFFIDACGSKVIEGQDAFCDAIPVVGSLRSVFGYSSACVPSIMTGRPPQEHLHWNYFIRGEQRIQIPRWLELLPKGLRDRGRVRNKLSKFVAKANNITGYFQLYGMPLEHIVHYGHCEPRNIFTPGGVNVGTSLADLMAKSSVPSYITDWTQPPEKNWQIATQAASDGAEVLFVYDATLDGWLHDNTRTGAGLSDQLADLRKKIDTVLAAARSRNDEVKFYIFSDHGMCTVEKTLDPFPALESTGLVMHKDFHCIVDSTMIRTWHPNDSVRDRVREALAPIDGITLVSKEYLVREQCDFPDNRFGDDIYLADPHLLLCPSHLGHTPLAAMHGYAVDHEDSMAGYLSNDESADPKSIMDLYPLMERALSTGA